jgi:phosphoserine phosphatase
MIVFLDCDSTLSSIEAVDELAGLRGGRIAEEVAKLTNEAMDGKMQIGEVFGARLDLIRPTLAECHAMGAEYVRTVEPTAKEAVEKLQEAGWEVVILSGGHTQIIEPLAQYLGVSRIEAVDLYFDEFGNYEGYEEEYPTTRNGGKPEVVARLKSEASGSTVMIGDGVSDLETKSEVDLFIGFTGYVERERIKDEAAVVVKTLAEAAKVVLRTF